MKPLILTLIFAVIATTVGAGWIITQLHSSLKGNSAETDQNLIAYKELGKAIGLTLDNFPRPEEFIAHWKERSNVDISLHDRSDFLVPGDIAEEFKNGTPLLLESEGERSLHIYMQQTDQVMSILSPVKRNNRHTLLKMILTLLFYVVIIAVLLAWLYPLIKRLMKLQKTAIQLGTGDLSSRVNLSKFSYISGIEKEFNRMANQIQKLVEDNQSLSRAVSHNLKTPITRLRMGIDVLEEAKDKAEVDRYIEKINYDLDEMQSLVETLLKYSELDEFKLRLENERINLCQFIPTLIENKNTTEPVIKTHFTNDNIVIDTDQKYLAMSLINILSNAIKHAKSTIAVSVSYKTLNSKMSAVSITVEDDGNGIPAIDHIHVTKPFWRGGGDSTKGHGMGLAIVERIADWLGAELTIDRSDTLGGASISLRFEAMTATIHAATL